MHARLYDLRQSYSCILLSFLLQTASMHGAKIESINDDDTNDVNDFTSHDSAMIVREVYE